MSFTKEEIENLQSWDRLPEFMIPVLKELGSSSESRQQYQHSWDTVFSDEIIKPMEKLKKMLDKEQSEVGQSCFRIMAESVFQIDANLWLNTLALLLYKNEKRKSGI